MKIPSLAEASFTPWMISASETATAAPWLSRRARRIRKSPRALGTRSPWARVWAFSHIGPSPSPSVNAFTMGAQPSAWIAYMRGRPGPR
jgi:hypothetical protein